MLLGCSRAARSVATRDGPLAIYDTMQYIGADVQTICFGIAMSVS